MTEHNKPIEILKPIGALESRLKDGIPRRYLVMLISHQLQSTEIKNK